MVAGKLARDIANATKNLQKSININNNTLIIDSIDIDEVLKEIANIEVLVGIPENKSTRKGEDQITNAELAFIHTHGVRTENMRKEMQAAIDTQKVGYSTAHQMYIQAHGSPAYRIPPRPIIEPAIEANIDKISSKLKRATQLYLEGNVEEGRKQLEITGLASQNYVRRWFTDPRNNWPPNAESTIKAKGSDRPLIDTGELRKSITYVLRETQGNLKNKKLKSAKTRWVKNK